MNIRNRLLIYFESKTISFCFACLLLFSLINNSFAQCNTLVWADEFNGTSLDRTKWNYTLGRGCDTPAGCGFGNGEEQTYTDRPTNISVANGALSITTRFETIEAGAAFTSAKIQTLGLKTFQYGKIEARMKLPSGQGAWPAFWMLAQQNNWPSTGEIDIMEAKHKNPTQVIGTVHHYNGFTTGNKSGLPDLSLDFHVYGMEWEKDEIRWYIDGLLYHKATPKSTGGAWPFNNTGNPFYLMLNVAVGGLGTAFTGNVAFNSADFPTTMQVDYVRVYSGTWNVEFNGDLFVYKGESGKVYSVTSVTGATGYTWTVPTGASIVSGQGTNKITVSFGSNAVSGNVNAAVTSGCTTNTYSRLITVENPFTVTTVLKDFDAVSNMTFKSTSGTLTEVANPAGAGKVGKYIRNAGELYDNLIYNNINFGNASDFVTRRRRIHADVYTSAPIGTLIRIQLENSAKSAQTFPTGRHSVYEYKTTVQNAWETVEFDYVNSPDLGTTANTVDQIAILPAVNTNTSDTYYIDNIQIGTAGQLCPRALAQTLEDFQTNRNITYNSSTGTYTAQVANPSASGVNTSAQVGRYVRNSGELYDVLFFKNVAVNNIANFRNGKSVFKLQVYSAAAVGTVISLQLETSASTPSNYPTGRHSLYQAVTTAQNQWQTLEFSFVSTLDALSEDAAVNSMVFLFSPNTNNASTYYIDNLITEAETNCTSGNPPAVSISSPTNNATFTAPASITINATASDSDGTVSKVEFFNGATKLGEDSTSPYSYAWTGVTAGTYPITAKATDNAGLTSTSTAVNVIVTTVSGAAIPGTIQAESYSSMSGVQLETTTDTGGGQNVGWIDNGDWMDYAVNVASAGSYTVQYRVASLNGGGSLELRSGTTPLATSTIPSTSGWQNWTTVTATATLTAGAQTLRLYAATGGFNVNYITFTKVTSTVCSGSAANGDYTYQVATSGANVNWTFIPQAPIAGSTLCILYVRIGQGTNYGYVMTQSGSNFTYSVPFTTGQVVTFYFTYRVGNTTIERNSSANPHNYTVGTTCSSARLITDDYKEISEIFYPNPVSNKLNFTLTRDGSPVIIRNAQGTKAMETKIINGSVDLSALPQGLYQIYFHRGDKILMKRVIKQ